MACSKSYLSLCLGLFVIFPFSQVFAHKLPDATVTRPEKNNALDGHIGGFVRTVRFRGSSENIDSETDRAFHITPGGTKHGAATGTVKRHYSTQFGSRPSKLDDISTQPGFHPSMLADNSTAPAGSPPFESNSTAPAVSPPFENNSTQPAFSPPFENNSTQPAFSPPPLENNSTQSAISPPPFGNNRTQPAVSPLPSKFDNNSTQTSSPLPSKFDNNSTRPTSPPSMFQDNRMKNGAKTSPGT